MGDHAGWDREYNLLPVKLNFLVVMGMARVFPEEGGAKNVRQRQKIFHLVSARHVVFTDTRVGSKGKTYTARVLRKPGIYRVGQIGTNFHLDVVDVHKMMY